MANKNVEPPNNAATPVNGTSDSCFLKLYLEIAIDDIIEPIDKPIKVKPEILIRFVLL